MDEAELMVDGAGHGDATAKRVEGGKVRIKIMEGEAEAQATTEGEVEQGSRSRDKEEVRGLGGEVGRRRRFGKGLG